MECSCDFKKVILLFLPSAEAPGMYRWFYSIVIPLTMSMIVVQILQRMAKKIDTSVKNMEKIRKDALANLESAETLTNSTDGAENQQDEHEDAKAANDEELSPPKSEEKKKDE
jgi:hypothetical protein